MNVIEIAESGFVPDSIVRFGVRKLLANRLRESRQSTTSSKEFADELRQSPLAVATDRANEQHYEVPTEFYLKVLGPRLKYSSCLYPSAGATLAEAESVMLKETCKRTGLKDGMRILELGCGWGSLTLWVAEHFPASSITAVSNSATQREFILRQADERKLTNVNVITADMRDFSIDETFDRVMSVEMFEHMRNYELLLQRVSNWLKPDGRAFVHIFCHRDYPYLFETEGATNWMGQHFFTGGMMPSEDLLGHFDDSLQIESQWRVDGMHYYRTCEAWLKNLDANRDMLLELFRKDLSSRGASIQLQRWRMFFIACAELFRYHGGTEWYVMHYLFRRRV